MSVAVLTQKSLSLFTAIGGWRTVAEAVASKTLFLIAYLLTGRVLASAVLAVGGVALFAVVRVCTDGKYWPGVVGVAMVGVSALLAGSTGRAADFYLPEVLGDVGLGVVCLVSMVVRLPVVGLVVGTARGERLGWRRDRLRRRRYQLCTGVFLAKFVVETAVLVPLYAAGQVTALAVGSTLLGTPAAGVCLYLCWRILRTRADPAGRGTAATGSGGGG